MPFPNYNVVYEFHVISGSGRVGSQRMGERIFLRIPSKSAQFAGFRRCCYLHSLVRKEVQMLWNTPFTDENNSGTTSFTTSL